MTASKGHRTCLGVTYVACKIFCLISTVIINIIIIKSL